MAKTSGMGDNFYIGGYDLSGDVGSLSRIGGGPPALEVTAIDKSAPERLGGIRDGAFEFSTWFNTAVLQEHVALSALPTANVIASYFRGTAIGNPAASVVAKQVNYDGNRGTDGSLSFSVQVLSSAGTGVEWGDQVTAGMRTDTGATAGTAFDSGAATTNFGLQAYLQVKAFTGTDVTVKLQESSDNAGDAYADVVGGGFTQITGGAPLAQRIATATNLAVERYLKVTTVTTGGFASLVFAVMVVRNLAVPT